MMPPINTCEIGRVQKIDQSCWESSNERHRLNALFEPLKSAMITGGTGTFRRSRA